MPKKFESGTPQKELIPDEIQKLREKLKSELGMELMEFNEQGQYPVEGYENIEFNPGKPENKWAWCSIEDNVQSPKFTMKEAKELKEAGEELAEKIREFRKGKIDWMQLSQNNRE